MARRGATRRELEEHRYPPAVTLAVSIVALFLGLYLPHRFPRFAILDLPLVIVIYFAVSRRSPITGTLLGTALGLIQDVSSNGFIGTYGIAKSIVGYAAASISLRVDVENILARAIFNFGFTILQSLLLFAVNHWLLGIPSYHLMWLHELLRAGVNTVVALPIALLLDRTRSD